MCVGVGGYGWGGASRGGSAMVVDKSVLPKVARRGRQRRTAAQAMAAAAGWPASLLAVTWIKILLLWRY